MISIESSCTVLLLLVSLSSRPAVVEGAERFSSPSVHQTGGQKLDCSTLNSIQSHLDTCFQQHGLHSFKIPRNPVDIPAFIVSFASRFPSDSCGHQFALKGREAYRCFHNMVSGCFENVDTKTSQNLGLGNLDNYAPDPDLLGEVIHDLCEAEGEDFECLDEETTTQLFLCGLNEFQKALPHLPVAEKPPANIRQFISTYKDATCIIYEGFQQCIVNHVKTCPAKMVSFFTSMLSKMTPPACHHDAVLSITNGTDQDDADEGKSATLNDEL